MVIGKVTSNRQPTLWLHDLCLKVLTEYSDKLRLFRHFPYYYYWCHEIEIATVDPIFNNLIWRFLNLTRNRQLHLIWLLNGCSVICKSNSIIKIITRTSVCPFKTYFFLNFCHQFLKTYNYFFSCELFIFRTISRTTLINESSL